MDDRLRDKDIPSLHHDDTFFAPKMFKLVFRMRIRNVPLQLWIIQAFDMIIFSESRGSRSGPDSLLPQVIARCGGKKELVIGLLTAKKKSSWTHDACSSVLSEGDRWENALEFVSRIEEHMASIRSQRSDTTVTQEEIDLVLDSLYIIINVVAGLTIQERSIDLDIRIHTQVTLSFLHSNPDAFFDRGKLRSLLCLSMLINACKTQYPDYLRYMQQCWQTVLPGWPCYVDNTKHIFKRALNAYFARVHK